MGGALHLIPSAEIRKKERERRKELENNYSI
jgi:hypothetical protein